MHNMFVLCIIFIVVSLNVFLTIFVFQKNAHVCHFRRGFAAQVSTIVLYVLRMSIKLKKKKLSFPKTHVFRREFTSRAKNDLLIVY